MESKKLSMAEKSLKELFDSSEKSVGKQGQSSSDPSSQGSSEATMQNTPTRRVNNREVRKQLLAFKSSFSQYTLGRAS